MPQTLLHIITLRTNFINNKNRGKPLAETQLHKEASSKEQQTQTIYTIHIQKHISIPFIISTKPSYKQLLLNKLLRQERL